MPRRSATSCSFVAAFIRQVSAGVWTFMPLGWRVHEKIVQIIREEMDAIGSQEMLMPVLTPSELWKATGRYAIPEVIKLRDRNDREFVLPMTHEETVAFHAKEIQSYRDLPQMLYHFQTKDRDEPRPRAGLIRVREFIMKDSYSFDRDEEGLDSSFQLHKGAYDRIFERCELEVYGVQAESGMMGGSESMDYLAPAAAARTPSSAVRTATTPPISRSPTAFPDHPSSRTRSTRPKTSRLRERRRSRTWPSS